MFDDNLIERFELASERIKEIKTASGACSDGRFSDYFCKMSEFIISMTELFGKVKNNEFEDAVFLAKKAYEFGVDSIIVQDFGLANFLIKHFPYMSIHASTQMSIHNLHS